MHRFHFLLAALTGLGLMFGLLTNNKPRRSRNRRAQDPSNFQMGTPITTTVTSAGANTLQMVFNKPVTVPTTIPINVATLTHVSQTVINANTVQILMSGTIATHAWTIPADGASPRGADGGRLAAAAGTF